MAARQTWACLTPKSVYSALFAPAFLAAVFAFTLFARALFWPFCIARAAETARNFQQARVGATNAKRRLRVPLCSILGGNFPGNETFRQIASSRIQTPPDAAQFTSNIQTINHFVVRIQHTLTRVVTRATLCV